MSSGTVCSGLRTNLDLSGIDYLGLERVLKRGTGQVIEQHDQAVFVHDSVSGAFLLGCENVDLGADILKRGIDSNCRLLMVSDHSLGLDTYRQYGYTGMLECFQTAYYGDTPSIENGLMLKNAEVSDLPLLIATYDLVSADELERIVLRKRLILGYDHGKLIGFIGEHLEGSMGLLYVFPEFRRKGYAVALEKSMIVKTLSEGYIPFGQVEKNNRASVLLQKKIGMTISERLICWMWK